MIVEIVCVNKYPNLKHNFPFLGVFDRKLNIDNRLLVIPSFYFFHHDMPFDNFKLDLLIFKRGNK